MVHVHVHIDGQYLKLQDRHKHRKVLLIPNMFIRLNKEHPLAGELDEVLTEEKRPE